MSKADFALARQPLDQWRRHSVSIIGAFDALDADFGLLDTDVILINTLRQWSLPGVVEWLESRPQSLCPQIAIILHYTPQPGSDGDAPTTADYRAALDRIARSTRSAHVSLFADSEELAEEFSNLIDLPVNVAPIPHVGDIDRGSAQGGELRVVAAGPARANKGFALLPGALKAVRRAERKVRLVVQGFSFHHDLQLARTITILRRGGATLLPDELSDQEFRVLIGTADLIILPYLIDYYHSQTSGVFAEAIGAGIPVVVPSGSWMARQVAQYGGGVIFDASNQDSFEEACLIAISNLDRLTGEAQAARDSWLEKHGARQFFSVVEGALAEPQANVAADIAFSAQGVA